MGWFESPQYLKGIKKIKAMSPDQKAVTQTLVDELSGLYAGADMQKQLQAMRTAADTKRRDRDVSLSERRLDLDTTLRQGEFDLKQDAYEHMKDETSTAENLGWANIGLAGLSGYGDMKRRKKQADFYNTMAKTLGGK